MMRLRTVMHIDVNSAYLAWEAVHALENGATLDYRTVPAIVGGDPKTRRGIVLAKSTPAKRYKIQTGESIQSALKKCSTLRIIQPSYGLYMACSNHLKELLERYTPAVQRFSVDEYFVDFSGFEQLHSNAYQLAVRIKQAVKDELGYTVNIGISSNKLLAKIAGDFEKPDRVHTLYPEEIKTKLWPLPIGDLYMVGRRTLPKLRAMGLYTIGDLAHADRNFLRFKLKSFGDVLYDFAHGIENSSIAPEDDTPIKGIGNSTTIKYDITSAEDAHLVLLSLCEMVGLRLRTIDCRARLVAVSIKAYDFKRISHQRKLFYDTDLTSAIYSEAKALFDACWDGQPIRHLGVRVGELSDQRQGQLTILDGPDLRARQKLDQTIDALRLKYGAQIIARGSFIDSGMSPVRGGTMNRVDYPSMKSQL